MGMMVDKNTGGAITLVGLQQSRTITGDTSLTPDTTTITTAGAGVDGVTPGTATVSKR